jgi:hypothetical protein
MVMVQDALMTLEHQSRNLEYTASPCYLDFQDAQILLAESTRFHKSAAVVVLQKEFPKPKLELPFEGNLSLLNDMTEAADLADLLSLIEPGPDMSRLPLSVPSHFEYELEQQTTTAPIVYLNKLGIPVLPKRRKVTTKQIVRLTDQKSEPLHAVKSDRLQWPIMEPKLGINRAFPQNNNNYKSLSNDMEQAQNEQPPAQPNPNNIVEEAMEPAQQAAPLRHQDNVQVAIEVHNARTNAPATTASVDTSQTPKMDIAKLNRGSPPKITFTQRSPKDTDRVYLSINCLGSNPQVVINGRLPERMTYLHVAFELLAKTVTPQTKETLGRELHNLTRPLTENERRVITRELLQARATRQFAQLSAVTQTLFDVRSYFFVSEEIINVNPQNIHSIIAFAGMQYDPTTLGNWHHQATLTARRVSAGTWDAALQLIFPEARDRERFTNPYITQAGFLMTLGAYAPFIANVKSEPVTVELTQALVPPTLIPPTRTRDTAEQVEARMLNMQLSKDQRDTVSANLIFPSLAEPNNNSPSIDAQLIRTILKEAREQRRLSSVTNRTTIALQGPNGVTATTYDTNVSLSRSVGLVEDEARANMYFGMTELLLDGQLLPLSTPQTSFCASQTTVTTDRWPSATAKWGKVDHERLTFLTPKVLQPEDQNDREYYAAGAYRLIQLHGYLLSIQKHVVSHPLPIAKKSLLEGLAYITIERDTANVEKVVYRQKKGKKMTQVALSLDPATARQDLRLGPEVGLVVAPLPNNLRNTLSKRGTSLMKKLVFSVERHKTRTFDPTRLGLPALDPSNSRKADGDKACMEFFAPNRSKSKQRKPSRKRTDSRKSRKRSESTKKKGRQPSGQRKRGKSRVRGGGRGTTGNGPTGRRESPTRRNTGRGNSRQPERGGVMRTRGGGRGGR